MAAPLKVSDRLLALAKQEAWATHRSATAQIEHWAMLGRGVEVLVTYREILALKRAGQTLPIPTFVRREDVHDLLAGLVNDADRASVKTRIHAAGVPLHATDPDYPGMIVEIQADGSRIRGSLEGRRFVPAKGKSSTKRK